MADVKITDLANLAAPDGADLVETVDVSDTSSAPTGTNKKLTLTNFQVWLGGFFDSAGSAAAVQTNLDAHEADLANPHATTAVQVGADPTGSAAAVQSDLDTHKTGTDHDGRYYTEAEVDALVAARVAKAGDTMTGLLTLSGDPTASLHAVTKQYADGLGGGASGEAVVWNINQQGHPFTTIGQPIYSADGATWATAAADDAATVHVAVTAELTDVDNFKAQLSGILNGITAATLTPGTYYYLADNGALSDTPGTINAPVLFALTATSALILPYRAGESGAGGVQPNAHLDGYTEQGDTTTLLGTGTVTVPMDGRIYEITQTGDITLVFGIKPTAPITASTVVMIKGNGTNSVTPPASTYWPPPGPVAVGGAGTITRYVMSLSPSGDQIMDGEVLTST